MLQKIWTRFVVTLIAFLSKHAAPIRRSLRSLLREVASHPNRGRNHSAATRILGEEVRTCAASPYRIFYRDNSGTPEVLAILHMARDIEAILTERLQ
jgi:plasmid stabilization system protein ParE